MGNRVPNRSHYDPMVGARIHTGLNALEAVNELDRRVPEGGITIAIDSETPSKTEQFPVKCVTACWELDGKYEAVLLDPVRKPEDARATQRINELAGVLLLHNAPFDVTPMHHYGWMSLEHINKITDTLVLARMAYPDQMAGRRLEDLVVRLLGWHDQVGGMEKAFKAAGYKRQEDGWRHMDIDSPIYRQGAILDTVGTLQIEPILRQACREICLNHPFGVHGATHPGQAADLIATQETVHRVMLRRTAAGLAVDKEHLQRYAEEVDVQRRQYEDMLADVGLVGGRSKGVKILDYLEETGELPSGWPRTPTGQLMAKKELLEEFDHEFAKAQVFLTNYEMVTNWIDQVWFTAQTTGRCHPQCGTLGAAQTGRMSYNSPPMQQFSASARPIIVSDNPDAESYHHVALRDGKPEHQCTGPGQQLWSIDWSQIEPITMACMAADEQFIAPYEQGKDLYAPLMRAAGIERDESKTNLLATMYGQGTKALARRLGRSEEQTAQIRRQILSAMPKSKKWMSKVQTIALKYGCIITAGGRILPVDKKGVFKAVNKAVQGGAYDILAETIVEMENRGIADIIMLGMHDEVVLDATQEQANEVREIMETPPDFLARWLGRKPILRTDQAPMGASWLKV